MRRALFDYSEKRRVPSFLWVEDQVSRARVREKDAALAFVSANARSCSAYSKVRRPASVLAMDFEKMAAMSPVQVESDYGRDTKTSMFDLRGIARQASSRASRGRR